MQLAFFARPSHVRYSGCSSLRVVIAVVRSDVIIAFDVICAVVLLFLVK